MSDGQYREANQSPAGQLRAFEVLKALPKSGPSPILMFRTLRGCAPRAPDAAFILPLQPVGGLCAQNSACSMCGPSSHRHGNLYSRSPGFMPRMLSIRLSVDQSAKSSPPNPNSPRYYMGLEVGGGSIVTVTRAKRPSAGPPFTRSNATVKVRGPRCTDVAGLLISGMNRVRTLCPSINLTTCGCIRS